jgi:transcriptional regulator with GAF, ATPase, and Fis domain
VEGEISWNDLVELFGNKIWRWERVFKLSDRNLNEIDLVIKNKVLETLFATNFSQKSAAERLRISARKLNFMIGKYQINHPSWRKNKI